jgi:hypothetical protein
MFSIRRELYGLFHVPDAAMPRDTAGQLMSPWNLVQSVLADEVTLNFVQVTILCCTRFKFVGLNFSSLKFFNVQ